MLDFQLSTVIFTVLNLLILYVVLKKLLFGRVNRILEERAALVEQELSSAERQKVQAEEPGFGQGHGGAVFVGGG